MVTLPVEMMAVLGVFSGLFTRPTFKHIQVLLTGSILCHGARRVTSILRVMGLEQEKRFEKYHRVLNRAKWNGLLAGKILLGLLLKLLPSNYPILMPIDDTIERRKGKHIKAKGCYRDACRSTEKVVVKCFGLKWICLTLMVPLPWSSRPWALPFMTVLAPSKKANLERGQKHKTSIDWAVLLMRVTSRWIKRHFVLIGDGGFACVGLGQACVRQGVTFISRLRLDAALYEFAPLPDEMQKRRGRKREKGQRAPSLNSLANATQSPWQEKEITWYRNEKKTVHLLSRTNLWYSSGSKPLPIRWVLVRNPENNRTEAFFSTDLELSPQTIVEWFVLRWSIEVTFEEVRMHLGVETQRQWSDKAIARTTPWLMGLFSLIILFAHTLRKTISIPVLSTAWYQKNNEATYSDILAFVKRVIWSKQYFNDSTKNCDSVKINSQDWNLLLNQLANVA